jgi:chromosome partitioning protein
MALVCSNSLLVPLQTEFFALEGLTQLMKTIERIKVSLNPDLKIRGILLTMYDKRNKLSSQVEKEARDYFNEKVYSTGNTKECEIVRSTFTWNASFNL